VIEPYQVTKISGVIRFGHAEKYGDVIGLSLRTPSVGAFDEIRAEPINIMSPQVVDVGDQDRYN
jgi:hypothetical protein